MGSAPIMIAVICSALYLLSRFFSEKHGSWKRGSLFGVPSARRKSLRARDRKKINFKAAALAAFLFIIGKIMDTLFKMISCVAVGDQYVHWYFAYEECFGITWAISFSTMFAIILLFGSVFFYAKTFDKKAKADWARDPNKFMHQLCQRFHPEYWYWEYVIFIRRVMISFFAVGVSAVLAKLGFMFVIAMFTWIQWRYQPFVSKEANHVEFTLLCSLPIMILTQMPAFQSEDVYVSVSVVISLLILLPIPLVLMFFGRMIGRVCCTNSNTVAVDEEQNSDDSDPDLERAAVDNSDESEREEMAKEEIVSLVDRFIYRKED